MEKTYDFKFTEYDSAADLSKDDLSLLEQARKVTATAYAPYSHFHVGAAATLENGETLLGTNQENASYPVGICAERALLSAAGSIHPGKPIHTMAISYNNKNEGEKSNRPVSPCGMCRQALVEFENRTHQPIRLILSGMEGKVIIIERASMLLPFSFNGEDLKH
jgi:cytidine deaminase